jgi:hypothetical protein
MTARPVKRFFKYYVKNKKNSEIPAKIMHVPRQSPYECLAGPFSARCCVRLNVFEELGSKTL